MPVERGVAPSMFVSKVPLPPPTSTIVPNRAKSYAARIAGTTPREEAANLALAAAVSAEVDLVSVTISAATPLVKSGRLRGLAVTSARRVAALPEVPTVIEAGFPGFDDYTWVGAFLPKSAPHSVVSRLNADVNALLRQSEVGDRLEALGFQPTGGTAEAFELP